MANKIFSQLKHIAASLRPIKTTVENKVAAANGLLEGKVAVVTGASRGIGFAIAKTFVEQGATVIAIARTIANLEKAQDEIGNKLYVPIAFDLSVVDDYSSLFNRIFDKTGHVNILVNAAGIKNGQEDRYWQFNSTEFDEVINLNVKSPFFLSRMMADYMIKNGIKGHIVNIIGIKGSIPEASPYSISKFGLLTMTQGMARMMAPKGIIVNGISPGATMTDMSGLPRDNYYYAGTPNSRVADPQEIANIALFLVSGMANNMVGSVVVCDGGEMLQYQNKRF